MDTNKLNINSKQCGHFDNSLWSFVDVSLPSFCQTLLRDSRVARSTNELNSNIIIPSKKSKVIRVKSAKCQVDLMANVKVREADTQKRSHRTTRKHDNEKPEQIQNQDDFDEKAIEHLRGLETKTRFATTEERNRLRHHTKITVDVQIHNIRAADKTEARMTEQQKENMERMKERHLKKQSLYSPHAANEVSAAEEKQTEDTHYRHLSTNPIIMNGDFTDRENIIIDNIDYKVCSKVREKVNGDIINNKDLTVKTLLEIEKLENETSKQSFNKEKKTIADNNTKETLRKNKAHRIPENTLNTEEVYTTTALPENEIIQPESNENYKRMNRYKDKSYDDLLTNYNTKNNATLTFHAEMSRNCERNTKEIQDKPETGTFQEKICKTVKRQETLAHKEINNVIKEQKDARKINRYFNADIGPKPESIKHNQDNGNSNKIQIALETFELDTCIGKKEINCEEEEDITNKTTQLKTMTNPDSFNCRISAVRWKKEHDNIFNDMKYSRSQTDNIEEQDNYEILIKNQMSTTQQLAQKEQNLSLNVISESEKQNSLEKFFNIKVSQAIECNAAFENNRNSAKQEVEVQLKAIQNLNGRKHTVIPNENSSGLCTKQEHYEQKSDKCISIDTTDKNSLFTTRDQENTDSSHDFCRRLPIKKDMAERTTVDTNKTMAQYKHAVKNFTNKTPWSRKSELENARMECNNNKGCEKDITFNISTDTNLKILKQQMDSFNETYKHCETEGKQKTEDCTNFSCIKNPLSTLHSFKQRLSKKERQITLTAMKAKNQKEYSGKEITASVKMNHKENDSGTINKELYATETNFATNKIGTLRQPSLHETNGMNGSWYITPCQDAARNKEAMCHSNSTGTLENDETEQNTKTVNSTNGSVQQTTESRRTNEMDSIGPESAFTELDVQVKLSKKIKECKNDRSTSSSTSVDLMPCNNCSFKQEQGIFLSRHASAQISTDCKTSTPQAALSRKISYMTQKRLDAFRPLDQIHSKANEQHRGTSYSEGSPCMYAMSNADSGPKRRHSSADRKISENEKFINSVSLSKRRSRSESLTRRCTLSKEWQLLTTTIEEMMILTQPKTEGNGLLQKNSVLCKKKHKVSDTSFNPKPIINRDPNAVQVDNLTTDRGISVAYDELQSTMVQYPRNSCQTNDGTVERRNCQEYDLKSNSHSELSSKVLETHSVVKPFLSNTAESYIGAPSLAETCPTESATLCNEQQIITTQDNGESNCRNNHKIQREETMNKEMVPSPKTNHIAEISCKLAPKYSYSMQSYNKFLEGKESSCFNYSALTRAATEKESCAKISTETEDCQLNYKCTEIEKNVEMRDAAVQCDLTGYRKAATQTDDDILKQNEQEIDLRFIDCNISESLTYPTLQLTCFKLQDIFKRAVVTNVGNKSITKLPETITDSSNFTPDGVTIKDVRRKAFIVKECNYSGKTFGTKHMECIRHNNRTGNGISMKATGQNELHKSNSLDDLCTILSTY